MKTKIKTRIASGSKKKMSKHKKIMIAGAAITCASFLLTIVPCKIQESNIASAAFCKLPNPLTNLATTSHYFYGLSNNPVSGMVLQFLASILVIYSSSLAIQKLKSKYKRSRVIDYTSKFK